MIAVNERIYVDTPLFAGWANVLHIIDGEMFPYQVKLEQPDADGHSIKRVCQDDISEPAAAEPKPEQPAAEESEYMLAKIITRDKGLQVAGAKTGMIWAVKEHMGWGYKVYHPETMQFKGIWRGKHLRVMQPHDPAQVVTKPPESVTKPAITEKITVKVVEKPKKAKKSKVKAELPGDSEQLSLFDF